MKQKAFKTLLILIVSLFVFTSCEPEDENNVCFYVKNNTSDTIYLHSTIKLFLQNEIMPYSTIKIRESLFSTTKNEYNTIYPSLYEWRINEEYLYIYLKDSVLVKTWNKFYTESELKQFFRETDWIYESYTKPNDGYKYHDYTFEILPEDLN